MHTTLTLAHSYRVLQELVAGTDEKPMVYGRSQTTSKWMWLVFKHFELRNRYTLPHCAAFWDAIDKHPEHIKQDDTETTYRKFGGPIGMRKNAFADDGEAKLSTYQILTTARKNSATNSRDYVYGLLGIFSPALATNIKVDYNASVRKVYTDFARTVIQVEKSLEILGQCDVFGSPTWTPRMDVNLPWYRHIHSEQEPPYNANAGRPAECHFENRIDDHGSFLHLLHTSGVLLDHLDGLSSANLETDFRNENKLYKGGYADQVIQSRSSKSAYASEESLREALWRVPGGNREEGGAIPAPETFSMLLSTEVLQDDCPSNSQLHSNSWSRWVFKNATLRIAGKEFLDYFASTGLADMEGDERAQYEKHARSAIGRFEEASWSRRISMTCNGYLCLVPWYAQQNDCVAIFPGCSFPVILRQEDMQYPANGRKIFKVISPCYVHGVMDGEVWADVDAGRKNLEEISLI